MKTIFRLLAIVALGVMLHGCKGGSQPGTAVDSGPAMKFLQGIQNNDKKLMYEAANLTTDLVEESRERLVNSKQNRLTDQQRLEYEHALRISGQIDFFLSKVRPMFPKSAVIEITQSTAKGAAAGVSTTVHLVRITYGNRAEAMSDKTGKSVKAMVVPLLETTFPVKGRPVHGLSFESKEFEKIAIKDFSVLSYY